MFRRKTRRRDRFDGAPSSCSSVVTIREVAAKLVVAPKTVASHLEHIMNKLGVARRAEIAAWAARIEEPASDA
jgi:hypothetical protein